jgi:hypothetical protein
VATYTYLVHDLRSNAPLAELPLKVEGGFGRKVKGYGELRGKVDLSASGLDKLDLPDLLEGGRRALYVDRDGVLVWGGIVWRGGRQHSAHGVQVQAMEFTSYFARRVRTSDYRPTQTDQLLIARTLISQAQATLGGDIGVQLGDELCGVLRDDEFPALKNVHEALQQQADLDNGFDYLIDVAYDSTGVPVKRLLLGHPRLGRGASQSGFVFELPGNITDWTDEWDAFGSSATDWYEVGEGEGSSMLTASASDPALIAAGFPKLETVSSEHRSVSRQSTLEAHARAGLRSAPIPVRTYACQVRADADPTLGSYIPGDEARFVITDDWYRPTDAGEPTFDKYLRVLGYTVNPDTDRVDLTLGPTL